MCFIFVFNSGLPLLFAVEHSIHTMVQNKFCKIIFENPNINIYHSDDWFFWYVFRKIENQAKIRTN